MATFAPPDSGVKERILGLLDKLPPFSPVLNRVMASLAKEDTSLGELAGLIETDTVLAGNILRVVNSPLYGRRATVNSVRHATALLGTIKIRNMVLGLSVSKRWAGTAVPMRWAPRQFNLHSLGCALLADQLVLEMAVPYAEGAFVAGLLHDIGKLLIAIAAPQELGAIFDQCEKGVPVEEAERLLLGVTHPEVSGFVLEKWNLPVPIRKAALYHHLPEVADVGRINLAHVIQTADMFVNDAGFGMRPYHHAVSDSAKAELQKLQLLDQIEKVKESFQTDFEALRSVL